jgi:flavin reductase (DIM6/NTAB) family NADH-FMN oxidoreductase RutF
MKTRLGAQTYIYPMPALLVGVDVGGKPNFMTVAWGGIANSEPPMITVAIRHTRYSLKGILENQAFSVNIPSCDQVAEADYCGMASGAKVDKVAACRFQVFYGAVGGAPLIEQCPVNLECRVEHMLNLGTHVLVVGRIEETHISQDCLTDGKPDAAKIKPLLFTLTPSTQYQAFGEVIAPAFSVGKRIKG